GTMGMPAIDYILADSFVVPDHHQQHFTEKVIYLPGCYQVNGTRRPIADPPARSDCDLPEHGFVFCCFNAAYKITAPIFHVWIELLRDVPGSVLWLLQPYSGAADNL